MNRLISGKEARSKVINESGRLYDMRDAVAFRDGSIPTATHLPLRRISSLFTLPRNQPIILFGEGQADANVLSALSYLAQYGFTEVYHIESKYEWDKA